MLRRLLILLLVLALPLQAVAGVFAPVCRHLDGPRAAVSAPAGEHAHCAMASMDEVAGGDTAQASQASPPAPEPQKSPGFCDDCGNCHHVAFSLFSVPALTPVVTFSPVRVARDAHSVATRVPAQPERPPRTAAA